jgi:peptidoglycan/xylan/chitin deacetylase (PgdA/CDA1 family)
MSYETQIFRSLFPSVIVSTNVQGIHLTFDDGPHPKATPAILQILKERNIKASFFLLGENALKFPDITRQIKIEGHQIGNHSHTHTNLFLKTVEFIRNEILQSEGILQEIIGERSSYFRPPYGYFTGATMRVLREFNLSCVLWSVDSKDFRFTKLIHIEKRVIENTSNGSILLFHDNDSTANKVHLYLPYLLDILQGKGFDFRQLPL